MRKTKIKKTVVLCSACGVQAGQGLKQEREVRIKKNLIEKMGNFSHYCKKNIKQLKKLRKPSQENDVGVGNSKQKNFKKGQVALKPWLPNLINYTW